jgi:glutathione synthase/RimK-type ligase-like ATP-grasp enzyme
MKPELAVIKQTDDEFLNIMKKVNSIAQGKVLSEINYSDLVFDFGPNRGSLTLHSTGEPLEETAHSFYVRGSKKYIYERYAVARYLKAKDQVVYNSDLCDNEALSKLEQTVAFYFAGLPIPHTLFAHNVNYLKKLPPFPLIVKSLTGSNGRLNFLVSSDTELQKALRETSGKALIQQNIENDSDYRVIIMYGQPVVAYRRIRPPSAISHLNNVTQGARRELVNDSEIIDLAIRGTKALNREFGGMDIIRDRNNSKLYILESNYAAGLQMLNDEVDKLYIEKAAKLLKKRQNTP